MGYNFRPVERDQAYLMPPSLKDWLPEDHLAWVVLEVVGQLDLGPIRARYRADGWGAAAFDPAMMTALLLYAYATGERSSRRIEARCRTDIAFRVITANQFPDHATIARFRADHELALGELFGEVLRVCAAAGLGALGLVALDGTRLAADAASSANRSASELDAEIAAILAEAAAIDAAEDAAHGPDRRGDELPPALARREGRLARLQEARRQLAETEAARQTKQDEVVARYEAKRAASDRRPPGRPPASSRPPRQPPRANPTDPDSRPMKTTARGWVQGYNGQLITATDGLVLAAELSQSAADATQLGPLLAAARANVARAGFRRRIGTLVADSGYWSPETIAEPRPTGPELLIAPHPGGNWRHGRRAARDPSRDAMLALLATDRAAALFDRRGPLVEHLFGHLKHNRQVRRFQRRGLTACSSEWRLLWATHNVVRLWQHGRPARGRPGQPPPRDGTGLH